MPTSDLCVHREVILDFFHPKPGRTTFFDWVKEGKVVSAGVKSFYRLNATLLRFGLPEVDIEEFQARQKKDNIDRERALLFTALTVLVEELLLCPADHLLTVLSEKEMAKLAKYVEIHARVLDGGDESVESDVPGDGRVPIMEPLERLSFCGAALDAYDLQKSGYIRGVVAEDIL